MAPVLVFAVTLFISVLISGQAKRGVLSTAVLFLVVGFVASEKLLGILSLKIEEPTVAMFARLALFSVLFTDGLHLDLNDLISSRYLPGRALILGMPLALVLMGALAHFIVGLPWIQAFLVSAVLSPTDPVFAAALIGRESVPLRLRRLLNIESGLNDGLALPVVVILLALVQAEPVQYLHMLGDLILGVVLGILVPWIALGIKGRRNFSATQIYAPFDAFAIALFLWALSSLLNVNQFLAAYAAGVTTATVSKQAREEFHVFGERVTELLKLAALFVFGALMSSEALVHTSLAEIVFVLAVLFLVRSVALGISLYGSVLNWRETIAAAWFGPKGFASVFYGLNILRAGIPNSSELFHIISLVIVASIIAHSSTDVLIARWFDREEKDRPQQVTPPLPQADQT